MTLRALTLVLALLALAPAWARAEDTPQVEAEVARRIREVQPLVDRGDFRAAIAALEAAPADVAASEAWAEDGARALSVCRRHLREQERFEAALLTFGAKDERPLVEWIRDVEGEGSPLGALLFVDAWRATARAALGGERYEKVVEQLRNDELQALDLETPDWPDGPDEGPPPPPPPPVRGSAEHTARLAALREAGRARLEAVAAAVRSADAPAPAARELDQAFAALRQGDLSGGRAALARARALDPRLGPAVEALDLARLERRSQPFRPAGATQLDDGGLQLTWGFDDEDEVRDLAALGDLELRAAGGALRLAHGSAPVPLARVGGRWRGELVVEAVAAVDSSLLPHRDPAPLLAVRGAGGVVVVPLLGDTTPCLLDRTGARRLVRAPQGAQGRRLPGVAAGQPVTLRASVGPGRLTLRVESGPGASGPDAFVTDVAWVGSTLEVLVGSVAPGRAALDRLTVTGQLDATWLERARVARRVEAVHEAEVALRWPVPAQELPAAWGPTSAEDEAGLEGTPQAALAEVAAARAARAAGELRAVQGCLSDALGRDPLCPAALYLSAQLALERDDAEAALGFADRALKAIDGFPEAERVRAAALLALGRSKEACEALERALEANRADPQAWLVVSDLALREGWPCGSDEHTALAFYAAIVDPLGDPGKDSPTSRAARLALRLGPATPELVRAVSTRGDCEDLPGAALTRRAQAGERSEPRWEGVWLHAAPGGGPPATFPDDLPRRLDTDGRTPPRAVVTDEPLRFFHVAARAGLEVDPSACVLEWRQRGSILGLLGAGDGVARAELTERTARLARERSPALPTWAARGEAAVAAAEVLPLLGAIGPEELSGVDLGQRLGADVIARRSLELLAVAWSRRTPWFDLVTEARRAIPWELDGIGAAQAWLLVAAAKDGVVVPGWEAGAPERPLAEVYAAWRAAVTAPGFTSRRLDHAWVSTFHALDTDALDARLEAWARAQAKARGIVFVE